MKFCNKNEFVYEGLSGIETCVHYVTLEDVKKFHGSKFAEQWFLFIKTKPTFNIKEKICYYYADYKHFAITTNMYLNNE